MSQSLRMRGPLVTVARLLCGPMRSRGLTGLYRPRVGLWPVMAVLLKPQVKISLMWPVSVLRQVHPMAQLGFGCWTPQTSKLLQPLVGLRSVVLAILSLSIPQVVPLTPRSCQTTLKALLWVAQTSSSTLVITRTAKTATLL